MYHRMSRSWIVVACGLGLVVSACGGDGPKNSILVTLTSPVTESYVSGEVTITVEVQGEVDRVALLVDGAVEQTLEAPPYTFVWNSDQTAEALHSVEVLAYGPGGSKGRSGQALVMVDRTAPVVDLSDLALPLVYTGTSNALDVTAEDDAGITALRLYDDGALVDTCMEAACTFDWDVSALADGEVILTVEAEDSAGNVGAMDLPVLVVNEGTPVVFYEGGGTANWVIPEAWQVMETDLKFHFDMPAGTTESLAVLQWSRREWPLELAFGTGECPDSGTRVAHAEDAGGQVVLHHAAADLGQTEYDAVMWFVHLSAGTGLDMGDFVGEGTRIAFVMVLY